MVHHIFPGFVTVHVPDIIAVFFRYSDQLGISDSKQIFHLYGVSQEAMASYQQLNLPAACLRIHRGMRIDLSCLGKMRKNDLLMIHNSAFYENLWPSLLMRPDLWKRTALIHWGSDVISYRRDKQLLELKKKLLAHLFHGLLKSIRGSLIRSREFEKILNDNFFFVLRSTVMAIAISWTRSLILPKLGMICTLTPREFKIIDELHGPCSKHFICVYNTNSSVLKSATQKKARNVYNVLFGNSGNPSNEHLKLLPRLGCFRFDNVKIIAPLGYTTRSSYKLEVIETGKRLLGPKFIPLNGIIPKAEYNILLQNIDILIVNAKRQQGLYCVYASLLNGKKVYLSSFSPTYQMLTELGIKVFDADEIGSCSFERFLAFSDQDRERNRLLAQQYFSLESMIRLWKELFSKMQI